MACFITSVLFYFYNNENNIIYLIPISFFYVFGKGRRSETVRFAETIRIGPGIDE